ALDVPFHTLQEAVSLPGDELLERLILADGGPLAPDARLRIIRRVAAELAADHMRGSAGHALLDPARRELSRVGVLEDEQGLDQGPERGRHADEAAKQGAAAAHAVIAALAVAADGAVRSAVRGARDAAGRAVHAAALGRDAAALAVPGALLASRAAASRAAAISAAAARRAR